MWIAEQMARGRGEKPAGGAELGVVTIGGAAAAAERVAFSFFIPAPPIVSFPHI